MTTNHQIHKPNVGDHVIGYSGGLPREGTVEKLLESPWEGNPVVLIRPPAGGLRRGLMASEIRRVRAA
jgi:hypothetical protein